MNVPAKFPYQMTAAELEIERARRVAELARIRAWRDAAVADGWSIVPTYRTEPVTSACTLERGGFKALILTRTEEPFCADGGLPIATIHAWCPDKIDLAPAVAGTYSWSALLAATQTCPVCGATDVETFRVAFANRACAACMPAQKAHLERGNWTA